MKYYVIAGEASGDLHASNLIKELKLLDKESSFRGFGGELMEAQGVKLTKHLKDLAFMGFVQVALNLKTVLNNISICKQDIDSFNPDAIILIDYPGFNLRIAEYAHKKNIKVFYYISPQIWAWKKSRIHKIKRCVDKMFVILPFEKEFYAKQNYEVLYVGNPTTDAIESYNFKSEEDFIKANILDSKPIIAILPGSRKHVIKDLLPTMLGSVKEFKDYQVVIGGSSNFDTTFYHSIAKNDNIKVIFGQTYDLLKHSKAALVNSGTASLESALIGTPTVLCYKSDRFSYAIAKKLVDVRYIGLANLICDKEIIKELLQYDFSVDKTASEIDKILNDNNYIKKQQKGYKELKNLIGDAGASKKCAAYIKEFLIK